MFEMKRTCNATPVQYEGNLPDGRCWYFRAKYTQWTMQIAPQGKEIDHMLDTDIVAIGDDPHGGYMQHHIAEGLIQSILALHTSEQQNGEYGP